MRRNSHTAGFHPPRREVSRRNRSPVRGARAAVPWTATGCCSGASLRGSLGWRRGASWSRPIAAGRRGADPLNLDGTVTSGTTVPRGGRVLYLDGVPIASQHGRGIPMSEALDGTTVWEAKALLRRGVGQPALLGAMGTTTP